ncbi:MAG: class I SAM-dependent methyltransferase [Actinobacteria bacterium]|nr:class I SAM-dependent methyltransferase [Actinomycetota bacterium]
MDLVARHARPEDRILEIGCGVGRTLEHLRMAGFTRLLGNEISEEALGLLPEAYPELGAVVELLPGPIEEVARGLPDRHADVVLTVEVLAHVHDDAAWVLEEVARVAGWLLVVIEDEVSLRWRTFPRNYRRVFEDLGFRQVEEMDLAEAPGFGRGVVARILVRAGATGRNA